MADDFAAHVAGVSALAEPARRALYQYVVGQAEPVSRDQAAEAVGLPRHTAKFHLDRLVDEGLLDPEFRRLSGRSGPGAGRPTKLYRRSDREVSVTLPERRYDLAGEILARAVDDAAAEQPLLLDAVRRAAELAGQRIASSSRDASDLLDGGESPLDEVSMLLAAQGYEPRREGGRVVLANCPFHALAQAHTELVCGMNLALVQALLDGLGDVDVTAALDPAPDRCCVTLTA